jgi:hypothetical protein
LSHNISYFAISLTEHNILHWATIYLTEPLLFSLRHRIFFNWATISLTELQHLSLSHNLSLTEPLHLLLSHAISLWATISLTEPPHINPVRCCSLYSARGKIKMKFTFKILINQVPTPTWPKIILYSGAW